MADESPEQSRGAINPPTRKGMSLGCQIVIALAVLLLVGVIFIGISISSLVSWVNNGKENAPTKYAPVKLAPEQEQELWRILTAYKKAYDTKTDFDASFTPELLNGFVESEIAKKKSAGTHKANDAEAVQVAFEGNQTVLRMSVPADEPGKYQNFEVRGAFGVEGGKLIGKVDQVKLAGREAPWLARVFIDQFLDAARKGDLKDRNGQGQNPLDGIKVLRREGEKIHVVVDGSKLPPPEDSPAR